MAAERYGYDALFTDPKRSQSCLSDWKNWKSVTLDPGAHLESELVEIGPRYQGARLSEDD